MCLWHSLEHIQVPAQYLYIAMFNDSYVTLNELQLDLCLCMGVVCYWENAHSLGHRSKHTCASTIYYQVDLVMKALHCKVKYASSLKTDPTLLGVADLILSANIPKQWKLVCSLGNGWFPLEYLTYKWSTEQHSVNIHFQQDLPHTINCVMPKQYSSDGWYV